MAKKPTTPTNKGKLSDVVPGTTTLPSPDVKHLEVLNQNADPLVLEAESMIIMDEASAAKAHELYAQIDSVVKEMKQKVNLIDQPLKDARAALKAEYETIALPLIAKRDKIKHQMILWREAEQRKADAEAQAQVEQQQAQAESISTATHIPATEIIKTLPPIQAPEGPGRGFHTSQGAVTWRKVAKWKVVDASLVPWSFGPQVLYCLDTAVLNELRRQAGEDLTQAPPGIEFYYDQTPVNQKG